MKKYRLTLTPDHDAESPRDWDNLGRMICFHGRYTLGDNHRLSVEDAKTLEKRTDHVTLPLYLYDHSGLTVSTKPFSCPWDSGKIGFIYASRKKILEWFGKKKLTRSLRERAEVVLMEEVNTYDQYLRGDVYHVTAEQSHEIETGDGTEHQWRELDSCGGIFGEDSAWDLLPADATKKNTELTYG